MRSLYRTTAFLFIVSLLLTACAPAASTNASQSTPPSTIAAAPTDQTANPVPDAPQGVTGSLVIYSGRSEPLIQPVIDAFTARVPDVEILLKAGSNSELANALIEEQTNTQADIFVTTELFTVQSLAQQGIFQPYSPAGVNQIPAEFVGPDNMWVGLTRRARVIMYNTELVSPEDLPASIFDLTNTRWKGQIAAAGSTNGSMQAQISAMSQLLGAADTEAWLQGLLDNEVTFFGGHTDVRKAVGAGEFSLGLVNHYYYYLQQAEGSPVGIIFPDQGEGQIGLISNATAVAILRNSPNLPAAQAFVDFLLSEEGQTLFAELNYEYPLRPNMPLLDGVQPLDDFRLADVDVAWAALDFDATFDLIEKLGMP